MTQLWLLFANVAMNDAFKQAIVANWRSDRWLVLCERKQ